MNQRPSALFRYWKNPYHLFQAFLERQYGYSQKKAVDAVVEKLRPRYSKGNLHIDKGRFSTIVQDDYLDLGDDEWMSKHAHHFPAMSEVISEKLGGQEFDILNLANRLALEGRFQYRFPAGRDRAGTKGYAPLRGVWQLFHASVLEEDMSGRRTPHNIRAGVLVVYGFLPRPSPRSVKPSVKALILGRTGVWQANAWMHAKKLFLTAEDWMTKEDQFFVFRVPDFESDPLAEQQFDRMQGIMTGTVLDENYAGNYPVIAVPCVARKLPTQTREFELHDHCVDEAFITRVRNEIPCEYFSPEALIRKSIPKNRSKRRESKEEEYYFELKSLLETLLENRNRLIRPLAI